MKGLVRSLSRGSQSRQVVHKVSYPLKALAISVAGTSGVGWGTVVLGDLPEGNILVLGAVSYLKVTSADADITAVFTGNYGVGSTATADATLTGTDVNVLPSTAISAATLGVSPLTRAVSTAAPAVLDNTDGSLELNLNLIIADAEISGTADCTLDGVVYLSFVVLGDD